MRYILALAATIGLLLLSTITPALAHGYKLGDLEIGHPFSKAMIPGAQVAGGYMKITNNGTTADRLISVSTPIARMTQLHEMKVENDIMTMKEIPGGIEIPAGQTVELAPGALHVMFMDVSTPTKEGDKIKAVLTFEKAGQIEVEFNVGPANPAAHADHAAHMDSMDQPQSDDPLVAIPAVMKALFETAEKPLSVAPVVIEGDYAIAGWTQDGRGGRALLKKSHHGWAIHLCSGDSLKDAAALEKTGMSSSQAMALAVKLAVAEKDIGAETLALFSSFEGTMLIDPSKEAGKAHDDHKAHSK